MEEVKLHVDEPETGYYLEIGILGTGSRMVGMRKLDWNRLEHYACEDECFPGVNRVKIKTVFLKSNIFFKVFQYPETGASSIPCPHQGNALLNNGFKLFFRGLECFFLLHIEPPSRSRFLHQGINVTHSEQIPCSF